MLKVILIVAGTLFLGLGILGIFLPLLPTTPFLLLAATCYLRGSTKVYHWLLNIRWLGNYVETYRDRRGVPLRVKILAIAFLWITIGYSAISVLHDFLFRAILVVIAIGVTIHVFSIPTLKG
jgi:uncharacterized membrane protein YbaN (DUF454 family)